MSTKAQKLTDMVDSIAQKIKDFIIYIDKVINAK